jgi:hypothetical protein
MRYVTISFRKWANVLTHLGLSNAIREVANVLAPLGLPNVITKEVRRADIFQLTLTRVFKDVPHGGVAPLARLKSFL